MNKSILIFTFLFFLGASLFAQDNTAMVEDDIILVVKPAEEEGLPVVTDIIFAQNGIAVSTLITLGESSSVNFNEKAVEVSVTDDSDYDLEIKVVSSIEDNTSQRLKENDNNNCSEAMVYPNPAKSYTNLVLPTRKTHNVYLYDMVGNQKMNWSFTNTLKEKLDLTDFQTGIYFIQLVCGTETQTLRLKIVR